MVKVRTVQDLAPPEPLRDAAEYTRMLEPLAREAYRQGLREAKRDFHVDAQDPSTPDAIAAVAKRLLPLWKRIESRNTEHWETIIQIPANANGLTDAAYFSWVKDNTALITKLTDNERERARKTVQAHVQEGTSYKDLTRQIQDDLDVGKARARLIARDQTLKANSQITEANHRSAGVTQFRWVANRDERTRPLHRAINGRLYAYPSGHPSEGIPGTHFQCRCFAYPVIPGVTDDEETADMIGGNLEGEVQAMRADLEEQYPGALKGPKPVTRLPRATVAAQQPRARAKAQASEPTPQERATVMAATFLTAAPPEDLAQLHKALDVVGMAEALSSVRGTILRLAPEKTIPFAGGRQAQGTYRAPSEAGEAVVVVARNAEHLPGPAIGDGAWAVAGRGVPAWIATSVHELGHAVHVGTDAIRSARLAEGEDLLRIYQQSLAEGAPQISTYAAHNGKELVAEAMTARAYHRAWMQRHHPKVLRYVDKLVAEAAKPAQERIDVWSL